MCFIIFLLFLVLLCVPNCRGNLGVDNRKDMLKPLQPQSVDQRQLQTATSTCNLTAYENWQQLTYTGVLSTDTKFWIYQTQPQIVLTNQLTIELAVIYCKREFELLTLFKAGRSGPITIQDAYIPMCSEYCLESDTLHQEAMAVSGCSCLELSTQPSSIAYTAEGDWCNENSARLLCNLIGYCGLWGCDLGDFMCPRYEWNKLDIPVVGSGSCVSAASTIRITQMSIMVLICSLGFALAALAM